MENFKNMANFSNGYIEFLKHAKEDPDLLLEEYRHAVENPEDYFQIYHVTMEDNGVTRLYYYVDENNNPCKWGPKAVALVMNNFSN